MMRDLSIGELDNERNRCGAEWLVGFRAMQKTRVKYM